MSAPFSVLFSSFLYALAVISKRLLMTRENKIVCQILFNGNTLNIFPPLQIWWCIQLFDNNISWYWPISAYTFCKVFRYWNSFSMKLICVLSIHIVEWIWNYTISETILQVRLVVLVFFKQHYVFYFHQKYILIVVQTIVCIKKTRVDRCNAACAVMQLICCS